MSGGYWEYIQYTVERTADDIERKMKDSEWSDETKSHFMDAITAIHIASDYLCEIDWLFSGDTGEENFLQGIVERLAKYKKAN